MPWADGDNLTPANLNQKSSLSIINVVEEDYGAVSDGTTDSTAAFRVALSAISATNGSVYVPAGVYVVSNLTMVYGSRLIGENPNSTVIRALPGTTGVLISDVTGVAGQGATGIRIEGIDFRANGNTTLTGIRLGYGLVGSDQFNLGAEINRVFVQNFDATGIDVNCNVGELQDIYCNSCGTGMRIAGTVARGTRITCQNSTNVELFIAGKDSVINDLHIESELTTESVEIHGVSNRLNNVSVSVGPNKTLNTIVYLASTSSGNIIDGIALNLDQSGASCTNFIYDERRTPKDIGRAETLNPMMFDRYEQNDPAQRYSSLGTPGASLGQNGDFFFRQDGSAGSAIYYRTGGSWVTVA